MGSARDMTVPQGYVRAYKGDNFDIYTTNGTGVDDVTVEPATTKVLENGKLYIIKNNIRYTIDGRIVE